MAENAANMSADDFVPTDAVEGGSRIDVERRSTSITSARAHGQRHRRAYRERERRAHGDLVFNGLHPYFRPEGGVTAKGWIRSLSSVLDLCDEETTVVPGHGPVGGREIVEKAGAISSSLLRRSARDREGTSKEDARR